MTASSKHPAIIPSKSAPLLSPKFPLQMTSDSTSISGHNKHVHLLDAIRNRTAAVFIGVGNKLKTHDDRRHSKKKSKDSVMGKEIGGYAKVKDFSAFRLDVPCGPLNSNPVLGPDFEAIQKARMCLCPLQR